MHKYFFVSVLLLIILESRAQSTNFINLETHEFSRRIASPHSTLLDVRTYVEYANGHIHKAGQLNYYATDFKQKLLLLPKDQAIYLYCNTGYRSKKAADFLARNGYEQVFNLERGIMDWNLNNLPVVVEENAKPDIENKMDPDEYYALIQSEDPVFIDFYAPWCSPCRRMMPMIDSLKTEYQGLITVVKINADASKNLMKELGITGVPYLVLYRDKLKIYEHNGLISRPELTSVLNNQN